MNRFVEFLKGMNINAAQYIHEMEQIIFSDPGSAIVKGRKFLEVLLNDIAEFEEDLDAAYHTFSLYEKINYLTKEHIIDGRNTQKSFDTVRILGNRAAHHSDSNEYADAFKIHKEVYNIAIWYYDLYFYSNNKGITVPIYQPPQPNQAVGGTNPNELVEMMKSIKEFLGTHNEIDKLDNISNPLTSTKDDEKSSVKDANKELTLKEEELIEEKIENTPPKSTDLLEKNLGETESYLIRELNRLKSSSKEAIENADYFSQFKNYLHIDRPILKELEILLMEAKNKAHGSLILLCGNVGDGKSHMLAYLNKNKPDLLEGFTVFNDATESFSPNKDSLETLEELLSGFSDEKINDNKENVILAINMGVLHNFISRKHKKHTYNRLEHFVEESKLFSSEIKPKHVKEQFNLVSFGDYNSFELTADGPISTFYSELQRKIVNESESNPFYLAAQEDERRNINTVVHENYKLLKNESVQKQLVQLIIQSIITDKLVISARAYLNFIADILIPNNMNRIVSDLEMLDQTLPNLLFSHSDKSDILRSITKLDPLHCRSEETDKLVIALNTLDEWDAVVKEHVKEGIARKWLNPFFNQETLTGYSFDSFFETFIRVLYLLDRKYAKSLMQESYSMYLKYLYHFNRGNQVEIKQFYNEFKKVLFAWRGSPKKDYIYINMPSEKFRVAQKIDMHPTINHLKIDNNEVLVAFNSTISLAFEDTTRENTTNIDIDYPLYELLSKVKNGYRPNKRDEENAIQFIEFIKKIMSFGDERGEVLIYFKDDNKLYSLKKGDFDSYVFEKEEY